MAAFDRADSQHEACAKLIREAEGTLLIPSLCIAEVAYLLRSRFGASVEARFVSTLTVGELMVEALSPADFERILELVVRYRDLGLGTVDASLIAAAERLDLKTIATLDHRHFSVVKPMHVAAFELVP